MRCDQRARFVVVYALLERVGEEPERVQGLAQVVARGGEVTRAREVGVFGGASSAGLLAPPLALACERVGRVQALDLSRSGLADCA